MPGCVSEDESMGEACNRDLPAGNAACGIFLHREQETDTTHQTGLTCSAARLQTYVPPEPGTGSDHVLYESNGGTGTQQSGIGQGSVLQCTHEPKSVVGNWLQIC